MQKSSGIPVGSLRATGLVKLKLQIQLHAEIKLWITLTWMNDNLHRHLLELLFHYKTGLSSKPEHLVCNWYCRPWSQVSERVKAALCAPTMTLLLRTCPHALLCCLSQTWTSVRWAWRCAGRPCVRMPMAASCASAPTTMRNLIPAPASASPRVRAQDLHSHWLAGPNSPSHHWETEFSWI